ncbi:MAG: LytTR family DNA-binding domain-containing protein [Marinoscillum sp.]
MRVVIIEDEAPAFRRLQKILEEVDPSIEIVEVIDSVEETVKWIQNHQEPDLYFMDIQLSDGLSFEIFDRIKINRPIIFTTAFDEYMLRAFKVNSIDYLLKPIKKEDLEKSLTKFGELRNQYSGVDISEVVKQINLGGKEYKSRFLVKQGDKMISVKSEDISVFQTRHGVVHITTTTDKKYLLDQTLDEIQEKLDPSKFFRANRQFIIFFSSITTVHKYHKGKLLVETAPATTDEIIVSAEKATRFKQWLDQ